MKALQRLVLFLLLLTVPFQAAVGATGYVCGHGAHHQGTSIIARADEAGARVKRHAAGSHEHLPYHAGHSHGTAASTSDATTSDADLMQLVLVNPQSGDFSDAETCEFCSECSFSLAPASSAVPNSIRQMSPLRVSFYVDPAAVLHVGDALFRPPRSICS